jgi:ABC-type Fe3+ transport system substrate-binding protein
LDGGDVTDRGFELTVPPADGNLPGGDQQSDRAHRYPDRVNTLANCGAAMVAVPHAEAARAWLDFVASDAAFKILEQSGFRRFVVKPQ